MHIGGKHTGSSCDEHPFPHRIPRFDQAFRRCTHVLLKRNYRFRGYWCIANGNLIGERFEIVGMDTAPPEGP